MISLDNDDRLRSAVVVNKINKGSTYTGLVAWHGASSVPDKVLGKNCKIWKKILSELEYKERVSF